MQESRIAKNYVACAATHVRVAPCDEGRTHAYSVGTARACTSHDDNAIHARCAFNITNGDRHVKPENNGQCRLSATCCQPMARNAKERSGSRYATFRKPMTRVLKTANIGDAIRSLAC